MKILKKYVSIIINVAFMGYAGLVMGADFQKGWDAYEKGDYTTAFKQFKPLAQQGNPSAQYRILSKYNLTLLSDSVIMFCISNEVNFK